MTFNELIHNVMSLKLESNTIYDNAYNNAIDQCVKELNKYINDAPKAFFDAEEKIERIAKEESSSSVNHPSHYNRNGAMECIDEMVRMFGYKPTIDFCKCNAWKYRYRAGLKGNAEDDLKKSDWYIRKAEKLIKKSTPVNRLKLKNGFAELKTEYPNDDTGVARFENENSKM